MSRIVRATLAVLCILGIVAAGIAYWQYESYKEWYLEDNALIIKDEKFTIESGASLRAVASELNEKGLLAHPKIFEYLARANKETEIKAGQYVLYQDESPQAMLERFISGKVELHKVTLIEGKTLKQWIQTLNKQNKLAKLDRAITAELIVEKLGIEHDNPEGLFLPETYTFVEGDSALSILAIAHESMMDKLAKLWETRDQNLPLETPYDALILASIIEKETSVASERDEIAGVFIRRLNKGMKLQTDPTIIYGMGDRYKGKIRRKDLREKNLYNTYVIDGLPPTPIAMPSYDALYAAMHPNMKGDALFFVAKGDGTHQFSATYEEHKKAVSEFQLRRRADYRSTPGK